jgi:F0F1-type ATP synthase membrane subunit b/b'/DNA-binding CsgD family transcriptional regulator
LGSRGFISQSENISIKVRAPWYVSFYAFAFYALVLLLIFWYVRLRYLQRFFKRREEELKQQQDEIIMQKEQAESEIIRLTNEKLQSEISLKNTQLANNTISIIRKNELLNEIQKELSIQKEELGQRVPRKYFARISKLIENSIKSDHDWEMFEKLFDQAHENFFQRLKAEFPELTPGDLRLSAYLRLNLSSKEIAPLLNISVRGVEERRYRLRKRMGLLPNQNLVEFILSF